MGSLNELTVCGHLIVGSLAHRGKDSPDPRGVPAQLAMFSVPSKTLKPKHFGYSTVRFAGLCCPPLDDGPENAIEC